MKSKHLALLVALAAAVPLASCEREPDYDLLIRGGTIYDGSGKPGFTEPVSIGVSVWSSVQGSTLEVRFHDFVVESGTCDA